MQKHENECKKAMYVMSKSYNIDAISFQINAELSMKINARGQ